MADAVLQVLIGDLTSLIQREIGSVMGVTKEMKKLSNTLTTIQKVLEDAEDKQFQSKSIQNWLTELTSIAYEIEDILDLCNIEVSKLRRGCKFNLTNLFFKCKIGRRMKEIVEKLDSVSEDRHKFHLQEIVVRQPIQIDWRRETGSIVNEPDHVYGRNEDKEKIVDMLVNQVKECEHLSVLPIIGIGGIGKTTLAQLVYNDERVGQHFDTKLWICVSDDFDLKAILKAMIESATGKKPELEKLDSLQGSVRQELNEKRYLLVLDDVWNENQEDWVKLKSILACGSTGASIVVTTRLEKVADIMGTLPARSLTQLSEEDCWLLFRLRAFGLQNEQYPNLETIGKRIVKKCGGVPLAAKALGGLLRFKRDEMEWIRVEESHIWNLPEEENSILPVLRLSYRHLPSVLKRCFIYCAVFPKDYVYDKDELIFCWMAQGCINGVQELEYVGDQIWNELALRSFFQEVDHTTRGETRFRMHDLVHDLGQSIMENKNFGAETQCSNSKIREVRWRKNPKTNSCGGISVEVSTLTTIMNYNRLRILKLNSPSVEELPSAFGKLKHLRYLDLTDSTISTLPRTFCNLRNLQILVLNYCYCLESLPKNIRCMTNLRHIFLDGCVSLTHMPYRIRELASLKTLSLFIVGGEIGNQLDELEHLNLGGRLQIDHLESVESYASAKKANLVEKPNLRDLVLRWEGDDTSCELSKIINDEKVLEALEPHPNLATLEIDGFQGREFALWTEKMKNLTHVSLKNCRICTHLPQLGDLPLLKSLHLEGFNALEYIVESRGESSVRPKFVSLEKLTLECLPNLKGLLKMGEMCPNLQSLTIRKCELLMLTSSSVSSTLKNLKWLSCSPLILPSFSSKLENLSSLVLDFSEVDHTTCTSISEDALESLCNLKKLRISNAQESHLPEKWFQGLNSLTLLEIWECKIGSCFPEGWMRNLGSLEDLSIWRCREVDVAEEIKHLRLLKRLSLEYDMVSLPHGLQQIPSLQSLTLFRLDQLTSLPDWLSNLASLTQLLIRMCPKISSLPSSIQEMTNLTFLQIWGCPELERRCEKPNGEDWHKIAHISHLDIGLPF